MQNARTSEEDPVRYPKTAALSASNSSVNRNPRSRVELGVESRGKCSRPTPVGRHEDPSIIIPPWRKNVSRPGSARRFREYSAYHPRIAPAELRHASSYFCCLMPSSRYITYFDRRQTILLSIVEVNIRRKPSVAVKMRRMA